MQFPIRIPGRLTRCGVFLTITLVSMNGCAISAEGTMAPSQLPQPEVVTDNEQQTLSPEVQFREIKKILGQIDTVSKKAQSDTRSPGTNFSKKSATEPKRISNVMMMSGDAPSSQTQSAMGKGKMMQGMSSGAQRSKKAMGKCKGMMCKKMMMNMSMMGQRPMPQATSMQASESLPGYPQAPHLYHLGEAEFFLDHTQALSLSSQQSASLTAIKNEWMAQLEEINAQISTHEQALWQATAQGQPDIADIRKKVADIETLSGQLRLRFIISVGKAVNILTPEQVGLLISAEKLP